VEHAIGEVELGLPQPRFGGLDRGGLDIGLGLGLDLGDLRDRAAGHALELLLIRLRKAELRFGALDIRTGQVDLSLVRLLVDREEPVPLLDRLSRIVGHLLEEAAHARADVDGLIGARLAGGGVVAEQLLLHRRRRPSPSGAAAP
jgi:hypothetical protein